MNLKAITNALSRLNIDDCGDIKELNIKGNIVKVIWSNGFMETFELDLTSSTKENRLYKENLRLKRELNEAQTKITKLSDELITNEIIYNS